MQPRSSTQKISGFHAGAPRASEVLPSLAPAQDRTTAPRAGQKQLNSKNVGLSAALQKPNSAEVRQHRVSERAEAMYKAIQNGNVAMVNSLIIGGADVNMKLPDPELPTPLHAAIIYNSPDLVRLLLGQGASVNATTDDLGWTPLMIAAATCDNGTMFKLLLASGADPDAKAPSGRTPRSEAKRYRSMGFSKMCDALDQWATQQASRGR